MLGDKNLRTFKSSQYDEFDRLLDEIIKAEEDFTTEIRFFTQRLADTESRIHHSIAKLMQIINDKDFNSKAM
jgi:hypothetical protein